MDNELLVRHDCNCGLLYNYYGNNHYEEFSVYEVRSSADDGACTFDLVDNKDEINLQLDGSALPLRDNDGLSDLKEGVGHSMVLNSSCVENYRLTSNFLSHFQITVCLNYSSAAHIQMH